MNTSPERTCFGAFPHCAQWHEFDWKVIGHSWCALPHRATAHSPLHVAPLRFAQKNNDRDRVNRCSPLLGNKLHIMLNVKMYLCKCTTRDVSGQSGFITRKPRFTGHEPNLIQNEKALMEKFQHHNKDILTNTRVTMRCITSRSNSKMLSKNMKKRKLMNKSKIAAALATIRTSVQLTFRFREIKNDVDANFVNNRKVTARNHFRLGSSTRSAATVSGSGSCSRDDAERRSQCRCALPVRK